MRMTIIDMDNIMMDNLLYAESKNLPLLKEAVMDFIVENGDEVEAAKISFNDVPGGVVMDLLNAVNRGKQKDEGGNDGSNLSRMRVDDLRKKLREKCLPVDGSREAMVALLASQGGKLETVSISSYETVAV